MQHHFAIERILHRRASLRADRIGVSRLGQGSVALHHGADVGAVFALDDKKAKTRSADLIGNRDGVMKKWLSEEIAGRELLSADTLASFREDLQDGRGLARARKAGGQLLGERAKQGWLFGPLLNQLHIVGTDHKFEVIRSTVALDADGHGRGASRAFLGVHAEGANRTLVVVDVHGDFRGSVDLRVSR